MCWRGMVVVEAEGLLFDMDGVLISSVAGANRCWRQWAMEHDVPGAEEARIKHGVRATELMLMFRPDWKDSPDREELLREGLRRIEDLEIADVADLTVLPGVWELLGRLPKERWTIVTSATRRLLLGRLKAAGLPFPEELITADDVVKGKPDPEPYWKGAAMLGFQPEECVVVEDAPLGVGSGKAAGSRVLGVLGTHEAEALHAAGADWVVRSLAGVQVTMAGGARMEFEVV